MRYGIPLLKDRVSPRCTIADSMMLVNHTNGRLEQQQVIPLESGAWTGLVRILLENQVETLVAGGIARETQQMLTSYGLEIVDNVACTASELLQAVAQGTLQAGFGFSEKSEDRLEVPSTTTEPDQKELQESRVSTQPWETRDDKLVRFDCLSCVDQKCQRGETCYPVAAQSDEETDRADQTILEVARDVSGEEDRQLCRVAELVYFCLGMKYKRIGIAYCVDLVEPAGILAGLLRRFFDVFPVCCKVGGIRTTDPLTEAEGHNSEPSGSCVACNPTGQAEILNRLNTDINIIVGLCMGVDCLFTRASKAPVSTLFVKDKSLVNNPIGAIYSDYYLNELARTTAPEKV